MLVVKLEKAKIPGKFWKNFLETEIQVSLVKCLSVYEMVKLKVDLRGKNRRLMRFLWVTLYTILGYSRQVPAQKMDLYATDLKW